MKEKWDPHKNNKKEDVAMGISEFYSTNEDDSMFQWGKNKKKSTNGSPDLANGRSSHQLEIFHTEDETNKRKTKS